MRSWHRIAVVFIVALAGCGAQPRAGERPDPQRAAAIFIIELGEDDSEASFQALLALAGSDRATLVELSAFVLGRRGDERARPILEALLDHEEARVRRQAVTALVSLGRGPSLAKLEARWAVEKDRRVLRWLDRILGKSSDIPLDGPPPTWARPGLGRPLRGKPM